MLRELPTASFFTANAQKNYFQLLVEIMTNEKSNTCESYRYLSRFCSGLFVWGYRRALKRAQKFREPRLESNENWPQTVG